MKDNTKVAATVAVYARTSKEYKGRERISESQQIEDGERLAETKGLGKPRVFSDPDYSGTCPPQQWAENQSAAPGKRRNRTKTRPDFTSLITAIEQGEIKTLITRKRDRLARNTVFALRLYALLQKHHVRLLCTHEALPEGNDGSAEFTYTILSAAAQFEWSKIRENTLASKEYARLHDLFMGGNMPFGYRLVSGKVETHTEHALTVKEVFTRFIGGQSLRDIGRWIAASQPATTARHWHPTHIRRMIRNVYYIGMRDYQGKLEPSKVYPALVNPALFWQANEILKNRRGMKYAVHEQRKGSPHLLAGFLRCGHCGRNLQWLRKSGDTAHAFCMFPHPAGTKQFMMTEAAWLEWAESFFAPMFRINVNTPASNPDRALALTKQGRITTNIEALQAKFASGDMNADLLTGALELAVAERDKLQRQLDAMPPERQTSRKYWAEMSFDEKRAELAYSVKMVTVHPDRVVVVFQPHTQLPPMTFPLMRRRRLTGQTGGRGMNCLTPHRLTGGEVQKVWSNDGVCWADWTRPGEFEYVKPALAIAPKKPTTPQLRCTIGGMVSHASLA